MSDPVHNISAATEYVLLPRRLTAENGAKGALIGEFSETFHYSDEGGEEATAEIHISWTTIKDIHKKVVELFGVVPAPAQAVSEPIGYLRIWNWPDISPDFYPVEPGYLEGTKVIPVYAQPPAAPVETCSNCGGTQRATYFSEQSITHEERECHVCRPRSSAATEQADRGTITRNLRGLASRMEYRVEAIEARDGKGQSAITGRGVGIGYLLAKDLAEALTEAATYIEGSPPTSISELPDDIRVPLHELQADVDYMIGRMIESGNSAPVITETIKSKLTALEVAIRSCAEPQAHAGIKSDLAECVEQGELRGRDLKQVFNPTERRLIAAALRAQPQAAELQMLAAIKVWLDCELERRPTAGALGRLIEKYAVEFGGDTSSSLSRPHCGSGE